MRYLQRYDAEEQLGTPKQVITWINEVLSGESPACVRYYFVIIVSNDSVNVSNFISKDVVDFSLLLSFKV